MNSFVNDTHLFLENIFCFPRRLKDIFSATISQLPSHLQDVFKKSLRRVCKTSLRRLQDVFRMSSKTSSRHLLDDLKTCLQDVLLEDVLQARLEDVWKTSWKTKKC